MKNSLLIIGKKSFIGKNLYNYSKKKSPTYVKRFKELINIKDKQIIKKMNYMNYFNK